MPLFRTLELADAMSMGGGTAGERSAVVRRSLCGLAAWACALAGSSIAWAQEPPSAESLPARSEQRRDVDARLPTRLYVGMWTMHLKHDVIALENNWLVGLTCRGFFGATFENSFGRRAFTGGIQRPIVSVDRARFGASLGYRLGVVVGYDGRFMRLARKTPVLPLAQAFAGVDIQRIGLEVSYTFVVVSVAMSYRF